MEYTILGRTGMKVSAAGLGAGGHSRLGTSYGKTYEQGASIVRQAYDMGVNLFDTAEGYKTEPVLKMGLEGIARDKYHLATKFSWGYKKENLLGSDVMAVSLDNSLRNLNTDYIDIYFIHGLMIDYYDWAVDELVPFLERAKKSGKVRAIGVTEMFGRDTDHKLLIRTAEDDWCDVMMVGFNMLNQSAGKILFPMTMEKGIGTLNMFAVRRALSNKDALIELITKLTAEGYLNENDIDMSDPFGFLVHEGGASSVVDAAYRFCRHYEGLDCILTGTGNTEHLKSNIASIISAPLSVADVKKIVDTFGHIDSESCN